MIELVLFSAAFGLSTTIPDDRAEAELGEVPDDDPEPFRLLLRTNPKGSSSDTA